jgi:two-component system LytT family response regulator
MNIQVGIVEDNQENIETLKYLLNQVDSGITIEGEAQTMEEAFELLKSKRLDLAFLDIQLRKGTVFEVLDRLLQDGVPIPEIVFVTAHGSFENALNAIKFACIDFITKPIDQEAIRAALERFRARKKPERSDLQKQVGFLLNLMNKDLQKPASIAINLPRGILEFTELKEILYFEADQNMSKVKLVSGQTLRSVKHLGHYLELLYGHQEFIQISKSCLVNRVHLKQYNQRNKTLTLNNGESLIASHRFSRNLKKELIEGGDKKTGLLGKWFSS